MTFKIDRRFLTHKSPLSSDGACKAPFAAFRRDSDLPQDWTKTASRISTTMIKPDSYGVSDLPGSTV